MPNEPPATRRGSLGSWLGMAGMAIAGIGAGFLISLFYTVYVFIETDMSTFSIYGLSTLLMLGPAAALWLTRNRYWRALAVGLSGFWVVACVLLVWDPGATMDAEEVEAAKAEALAAGHPTFYLGDRVDGHPLNGYLLASDQANFRYGDCPDGPGGREEECMWDVAIYNFWTDVTIGGDAIAGCTRQAPVAGVPTVYLHHEVHISDQIVLFTGDTEVSIEVAGEPSLEEMLRIAREVRQVGQAEAATSLPPPTPAILEYVEHNCAPIP